MISPFQRGEPRRDLGKDSESWEPRSSALKPLWKAQTGPLEMKISKCDQRDFDIARRINVSANAQ